MSRKKLADAGPPLNASNAYIVNLMLNKCTECAECGATTHYTGAKNEGFCAQVHVAGRVMPARRAMYMAALQKPLIKGRRVTSRCRNPDCINPAFLYQATPGQILKADYVKGNRSRQTAAAHLLKFRNLKLNADTAMQILADERTGKDGAADYGISAVHFNSIKRGQAWKQANPFAGLLA